MSAPRRGPGRPAKADKFGGQVAAAEQLVADRLPFLVEKLFELADGVHREQRLPSGQVRVYRERPDFKACEYLLNRILGRPTERHEHTGEDGEPMRVVVYIPSNGRDDPPPQSGPARGLPGLRVPDDRGPS